MRKPALVLIVFISVLWVVFTIATIMDVDIVYNYVSPFISLASAVLILYSRDTMGRFWRVGRWFMLGVFVWFIADILWIVQTYLITDNQIFTAVVDEVYLIPDFLYAFGIVTYALDRFTKNSSQMILTHAFIIAIVIFITAHKLLVNSADSSLTYSLELVTLLLYMFVTLFTLVMMVIITINTGIKKHTLAFYMIAIFLFVFNIFECRYTAFMFWGREPESIYIDIIYMLCIVVYATMFSLPSIAYFDGETFGQDIINSLENKKYKISYWIFSLVIIIIMIVLFAVGFFNVSDTYYVVTAILAYIIMCKTIQENVLTEELLARQKDENSRLEKMVADKTKELSDMNEYLKKISNTDALTGLYNRRYGLDYLQNLIKDAENYPIALYSLDLNYFKPINDNYGHDMGDVVLKEVGRRLARLGQERCTAIRVGGDEFLIIFRNATNDVAVKNMGDLISSKMDEPINAVAFDEEKGERRHTFQISASMGVACFPVDTNDMETLFKLADEALYAIKHTHEKSAFLMYKEMESFKNSIAE